MPAVLVPPLGPMAVSFRRAGRCEYWKVKRKAGVTGADDGEAGVPEDRPLSSSPSLFLTCLREKMYSNGAAFKTLLKGSPQELRHLAPPQSSCAAAVRCVLPSFGFYVVVTKDAPYSSFSVTCPLLSNSAMRCGVWGPVLASARCRGHRISAELNHEQEGCPCWAWPFHSELWQIFLTHVSGPCFSKGAFEEDQYGMLCLPGCSGCLNFRWRWCLLYLMPAGQGLTFFLHVAAQIPRSLLWSAACAWSASLSWISSPNSWKLIWGHSLSSSNLETGESTCSDSSETRWFGKVMFVELLVPAV